VWKFFKQRNSPHKLDPRPLDNAQLRREIGWSLCTAVMFSFVAISIVWLRRAGYTSIYANVSDHGAPYLILSVICMLMVPASFSISFCLPTNARLTQPSDTRRVLLHHTPRHAHAAHVILTSLVTASTTLHLSPKVPHVPQSAPPVHRPHAFRLLRLPSPGGRQVVPPNTLSCRSFIISALQR
jgi:hypothetical protein